MPRCPVLATVCLPDLQCVASLPAALTPLLYICRARLPAYACCEGLCIPQALVYLCLQLRPANAAEEASEAASHAGTACFHGSCNQLLEALVCL